MLDHVLTIFDIKLHYDLNLMSIYPIDVTARVLTSMHDILKVVHPNIVFVHGDED